LPGMFPTVKTLIFFILLSPSAFIYTAGVNISLLIDPFLAGLSTGVFCLATCVPFLAPFLAAEERGLGESSRIVLKFILGRLIGYVLFGLLFGYLGEHFQGRAANGVAGGALILLALVLALYLVGLVKPAAAFCSAPSYRSQSPLWMGFFMGVNVCPPFLLSLAYVFSLHSTLQGLVYFLVFFAATSLYLLPLIFVGLLSKLREFQTAARLSGFAVSIIFIIYAVRLIVKN